MTRSEWMERWIDQGLEWDSIKDEMIASGKNPSCYQVSLEQRRRAMAEGRRLVTYSDLENATA